MRPAATSGLGNGSSTRATIRADLKLEGMEPIGNYAIRLVWNDGHSSGLYTWETLERLALPFRV